MSTTIGRQATTEQLAYRRRIHAPAIERAKYPAGLQQHIADSAAAWDAMVAGMDDVLAEAVRVQLSVQAAQARALRGEQ